MHPPVDGRCYPVRPTAMQTAPLTFALAMPIGPSDSGYPLLEQALVSIAAQSISVRLAVLDASGDPGVAALLDRFAQLISHRRTGPDDGQAAAIQEGWDALSGDVYGWLNADDLLYPGALAAAAARFGQLPGADVVTGQSLFFSLRGEDIIYRGLHPEARPPDGALSRTNTISQPSTFVRAGALQAVHGLDTTRHYTMDWDLWLRLQDKGAQFVFDKAPYSAVFMESGTKTAEFGHRRRQEISALVASRAGHLAAWKSLFAFWLTHKAEAEALPGRGMFTWLRETLQQRRTGSVGPPASDPAVWPLIHYGSGPASGLRVETDGPVTLSLPTISDEITVKGKTEIACNVASGSIFPVSVRASPGARLKSIALVG